MATIAEQITEIEAEILKTQKNKATEFHIGKLKAKIAKLRQEQEKQKLMGGGGGGKSFAVKKSGNATVGLVGLPSVGKSTLMNKLTGTESETAAYAFTTLDVIPGSMEHNGAKIQILDMPGIIKGAASGKGRGKEVLAAARSSDLIWLTVNAYSPSDLDIVLREIWDAGIRLNERKADIQIVKRDRGGLDVQATVTLTNMDEEYIQDICKEFKVVNAIIVIREDITIDQLIDKLAGNRVYTRGMIVLTKCDLMPVEDVKATMDRLESEGWSVAPVAAVHGTGIEELKDKSFEVLDFIRVYLRPNRGEIDYKEPLVITNNSTVGDVCDNLHRDFRRLFRYAQVWGKSAKFPGQHVAISHVLQDHDVLTIVTRQLG